MTNNLYGDFYFIYVLCGANYIRPVIKSFEFVPDGVNIVILTNTPGILKDIKPTRFNLIVDDLEKYRDDWSRKNEPIISIDDEQGYMDEYWKQYFENNYRFPCAIIRFGVKWVIENQIKKFILCDCGCKIGFDKAETDFGLKKLNEIGETKNVMFGCPQHDPATDQLIGMYQSTSYREIIEKYVPNFNLSTHPPTYEADWNPNQTGCVGWDGFCLGFIFHDNETVEKCFNLWCDIVQISYETGIINPQRTDVVVVDFEYSFKIIGLIFSKYYNTVISGHWGIIRHFYHIENDFKNSFKNRHVDLIETETREEFIEKNREKIASTMGHATAKIIIDGF